MYLETWPWSRLTCPKKASSRGEWIYGITWKHVYFNISVLFIVDITTILKLVFPTLYCFCLDGHLGGCVVAIIVAIVFFVFFLFIHLFIYLFTTFSVVPAVSLIFVVVAVIATVAFVVCVIVAFCVCLLCVPYFTVNSVDE